MESLDLARLQFAITTVYHFFFVPLTLGLSVLLAILQTIYVRTGDETYKRMVKFWGKLFLINFAMGVVTGIVQEFQFGMNWSEYARYVGDIFGAPLAVEALMAFFIESTFLGVWIFGWDRLGKKAHLASIWLVAIAANLSALWILIANSFMQEPVGYVIRNGRAEMTDFFALITNPNVIVQWPHVFFSGVTTAGFFVLGISAYHLLRKSPHLEVFNKSFQVAVVYAIIGSFLVILVGHPQAQHMVQTQPMKMAAAEALWESEDPASFSLITIGDEHNRKDVFAIRIPALLSILAYNQPYGLVKGINNLQSLYEAVYGPGNYVPPVALTYWSFRFMVGSGFLMALLALIALIQVIRKRFEASRRLLRWLPLAIILPYVANTFGWLMTELGRQPWIVYGLLQTQDAVSPNVPAAAVLISVIGFTLLYGALMAADLYLLQRFARAGLSDETTPGPDSTPAESF